MANWTRREVTTRRVEYALPNPTNWFAVQNVLALIHNEKSGSADDRVRVEAHGGEIVFSYEVASDA